MTKRPEDGDVQSLDGVELWFVRHGESVNNAILSRWGGLGTVLYPVQFVQDPPLTPKGRAVAVENGARLVAADIAFDLVFSSAMVRTMQTAHAMFVESKLAERVFVVPFLSEVPMSWHGIPIYENMPLPRGKQQAALLRQQTPGLVECIDWSFVGGRGGSNAALLPPSGDGFLRWLAEQDRVRALVREGPIAGSRREEEGSQNGPGTEPRPRRIAIVTHSNLMVRDTIMLPRKPGNSDIWTTRVCADPMDGSLFLSEPLAWFRGHVEQQRQALDGKIRHVHARAAKKDAKMVKKAGKIEKKREKHLAALVTSDDGGDDDDEEGEDRAEDRDAVDRVDSAVRRAQRKLDKLVEKEKRLSKKQAEKASKYASRLEALEQQRDDLKH